MLESKLEEFLQKYEEKQKQQNKDMKKNVSGVFLHGCISGIILSYSGILGYIVGLGTGVILVYNYRNYTDLILEKIITFWRKFSEKLV